MTRGLYIFNNVKMGAIVESKQLSKVISIIMSLCDAPLPQFSVVL